MSTIPTTNICMIGPRGVGKTSLLAAMYNELKSELTDIGATLAMQPGQTQAEINDRLVELKTLGLSKGFSTTPTIGGTLEERQFNFNLSAGDSGTDLVLRFTDLPGGWYTNSGNYQRADEVLASSHVSFLAVDAPALMDSPVDKNQNKSSSPDAIGINHDFINLPFDIEQSYLRAKQAFSGPHLVVVTLIRAEKYLQSEEREMLFLRAQAAYRSLAKQLATHAVVTCLCAVETVGGVVFSHFSRGEKGSPPFAKFIRNGRGYDPKFCALPLRIAIGVALLRSLEETYAYYEINKNIITDILEWIGIPTNAGEAQKKYERLHNVFLKLTGKISDHDYLVLTPK